MAGLKMAGSEKLDLCDPQKIVAELGLGMGKADMGKADPAEDDAKKDGGGFLKQAAKDGADLLKKAEEFLAADMLHEADPERAEEKDPSIIQELEELRSASSSMGGV